MGDRLGTNPLIRIGQAAELVVLVLEHVGVDRPDPNTTVLGVPAKGVVVVGLVPRDVKGDSRGDAGEGVDLSDVVDLLVRVTGDACGGEDAETSARVAEGPAGQLDCLGLQQVECLRG